MRAGVLIAGLQDPARGRAAALDMTPGRLLRDPRSHHPAARVPVLVGTTALPSGTRWPLPSTWPTGTPGARHLARDARQRTCRNVCAEMHAGFGRLRTVCPMNIEAALPEVGARLMAEDAGLRQDTARIDQLWTEGTGGERRAPPLWDFSAADAFFPSGDARHPLRPAAERGGGGLPLQTIRPTRRWRPGWPMRC